MRPDHIWIFALEWDDAKASIIVHARTREEAIKHAKIVVHEKIQHPNPPTVFKLVGNLPDLIEKGNGGFLLFIATLPK